VKGIVLEADSWTWHAEKRDHDRDCARYNAMVVAGWVVLRFTWEHVMNSPEYVVRTIRGASALAA
jgi:very-short-patch-repair endonuclease